jgi:transposase
MRRVRDLARARYDLIGDRTRVKQRIEKLLEDALIKLSVVLSDIHGVTGRAIIEALIDGTRDPVVLAGLAKGKAKARRDSLVKALDGRFTEHHGRMARMLLDQIDELDAHIDHVTALIDDAIAELPIPLVSHGAGDGPPDSDAGEVAAVGDTVESAVARLSEIPGMGPDTARAIIGEVGTDMTVFGTSKRLCAWARTSPRTVQSGRKNGKARTGKGNRYLKAALGQIATSAAKTDTFLGERYRRLIKRMPKPKAKVALERSILVVIFALLSDPAARFHDLGSDHYQQRVNKTRRTRQLTHQLETLGYTVSLTAAAA